MGGDVPDSLEEKVALIREEVIPSGSLEHRVKSLEDENYRLREELVLLKQEVLGLQKKLSSVAMPARWSVKHDG